MYELRNPVEYVPPEVWEIIFENLLNSEQSDDIGHYCKNDMYSCYMVCTVFRNILNATKSTWLFQEVMPMIAPYLPRMQILEIRHVCKSWKQGVDQYLENQDIIASNKSYTRKWTPRTPKYFTCSFSTSLDISNFLEDMQSHPGNPFPGRTLSLAFESEPTRRQVNRGYAEFWNSSVFELLLRFGDHITTLHLKLCFKNTQWTKRTLTQMRILLETTPNLRSLHLQGFSPCHYEIEEDMRDWGEVLPYIPTLKYLQFTPQQCPNHVHCNSIPVSVQYFICYYHFPQLQRLEISFADRPGKVVQPFPAAMPDLQVLRVKVVCGTQLVGLFKPATTNHFSQLRSVTIEIVKLKNPGLQQQENLGDIIRLVQPFKQSIRELVIVAADKPFSGFTDTGQKDLKILKDFKNLKYLHIQGFFFINVPIVNYLPGKLEYIYLGCSHRNYRYGYGQTEFQGCTRDTGLTEWSELSTNLPRLGGIWVGTMYNGDGQVPSIGKPNPDSKCAFQLLLQLMLTLIFLLVLVMGISYYL